MTPYNQLHLKFYRFVFNENRCPSNPSSPKLTLEKKVKLTKTSIPVNYARNISQQVQKTSYRQDIIHVLTLMLTGSRPKNNVPVTSGDCGEEGMGHNSSALTCGLSLEPD